MTKGNEIFARRTDFTNTELSYIKENDHLAGINPVFQMILSKEAHRNKDKTRRQRGGREESSEVY